ncbi:DUF1254 containing protein [Flavobacterium anhuiense]|uniref:DUF1254 containing protein n=1 Tax=Flavobacterium anhuiense TaxID=459526 RepID=A0A444VXQ9_9FLAO|nr:DUF1254 domain-containing protein [Flavobacterium anhuiense]RYJ38314.1 DUF1254 containing protein [Flavobacterium anhuiense]
MKKLLVLSTCFFLIILTGCKKESTTNPEKATAEKLSDTLSTDSIKVPGSDVLLHPEYAKTIARAAYIWGYPLANVFNRRNAFRPLKEPGRLNGVLPGAPLGQICMLSDYIAPQQNSVACPNQDVAYGYGYFELDKTPVVIQVPDFGDRFWVYALYNARTEQTGHVGKMYNTKPGFYLLHGPNWKGEVPSGITGVIKFETELGNAIPRVFLDDTPQDRAALQPVINQIVAYPLSEFDGKMKTKEWSKVPNIPTGSTGGGEIKWVVPEKFFDLLPEILEKVPPLKGEEALYAQFKALLATAAKDPEIKKIIVQEAVTLDQTLIKDYLKWKYNGKPAGNGWNRSFHNAVWGFDYTNRTSSGRSNIFDNRPTETQYFYTDNTTKGEKLNGNQNYKVTFKVLPPVKGFWSMTLYNAEHFFFPNDLKRYSLGTKNKGLKKDADGSLTLYVGNKNPGVDKESNWIPAPKGDFSLYIRAYWGEKAIIDESWIPPVVEKY